MTDKLNGTGEYKSKTGTKVQYEYEYSVLSPEQVSDLNVIFESAGKLVQRMLKVDANNTAREKAKSVNGDSTRTAMTEEEKAQAKVKRATQRELLKRLEEKGITSPEELDAVV